MKRMLKTYRKYIIPVLVGVFLFALITNYESTMQLLSNVWGGIWFALSRIVGGFALAYILNLFVNAMRRHLKFPKWLAIVVSYVILLGVIVWMILYIVPYIKQSVEQILDITPTVATSVEEFLRSNAKSLDEQGLSFLNDFIDNATTGLVDWISSLVDLSSIVPVVSVIGRTLLNLSFWFMISVYALIDKERVLRALQRIIRAFMKPDKAESRIQFFREANSIFSKYVVGKFFESFIVGLLSLGLYGIFGLEMWPFLAFLAFVFNMIPYFGPLISAAASVAILLLFNPIQALYCLIICVALQTLDGSVIGPRILGNSVGLSPLLTIIAIAVGGDLAGLAGIFLSVPILAIVKTLIVDRAVEARLQKRAKGEIAAGVGGEDG
ncbi:MAG: AI-2E family transporter, partial [Oscillospiraceae bacterium]|nr:AI-2E family transporter [Oscillospiraceae bacterium]